MKGKDTPPKNGFKLGGNPGRVPPKSAGKRKKPIHMKKGSGTPNKPKGQSY